MCLFNCNLTDYKLKQPIWRYFACIGQIQWSPQGVNCEATLVSRHLRKQCIFVWCCRTRGWHSAAGQCVRRRILRPDITGWGLGGASGTAPIIRHGRSGEVQAALYTGAQPVGGHYSEFPSDEMFNLCSAFNRPRGLNPVNLLRRGLEMRGRGWKLSH